jgi:transcriptional regulator with XRE-family HTH domain
MTRSVDPGDAIAFGARLQLARKRAGYKSARALAAALGVSDGNIRAYEVGRQEPTRPILVAMAQLCGVSLDWLAIGVSPMPQPVIDEPVPAIPDEIVPETGLALAHARQLGMPDGFGIMRALVRAAASVHEWWNDSSIDLGDAPSELITLFGVADIATIWLLRHEDGREKNHEGDRP